MKFTILASAVAAALLVGCVTADKIVLDSTPRKPTMAVDVYKEGKQPSQNFKEIFLGPREEEFRAQKRFIKQAKEMGGNGILFSVVSAGEKGGGGPYGFNTSTAWLFKGTVIVYEENAARAAR
jgi:hypothetical protein